MQELLPYFIAAQIIATVVLAAFGGYIAYQQWQTAKAKVRLDLYERRFKVYRGVMDFLGAIARDAEVTHETLNAFYKETDEKRFLFNDDLKQWLKQLRQTAVQLRLVGKKITALPANREVERLEACDEDASLLQWFDEQIEQAESKFERYLTFKDL